jgi:hypothetical protein
LLKCKSFEILQLAFYGVRAFERSMYSTLVPEHRRHKKLGELCLYIGLIWR